MRRRREPSGEETQRMGGPDPNETQRISNRPDPDRTQRMGPDQPRPGSSRGDPQGTHKFDDFDYFYERNAAAGSTGPQYENSHLFEPRRPEPAFPEGPAGGHLQEITPSRGRKPGGVRRKVTAVLAVIAVLIAGAFVYVDLKLTKIDALTDYEERPPASPGQNWLLVGSDSREQLTAEERRELNTGKASGGRTDTIMILHIPRFGGKATLVSLPRDSLVDIPAYVDEDGESHSAQQGKLNWAFSYGGPQLLAKTIETETGIRLDEYMEIGLGGFAGMVDAVGGVRMCLEQPIEDEKAGIDLPAGCQKLTGPQALGFVRARYFDPRGDLGRVERQRRFLQALSEKVSSPGTLLNPLRMTSLMNATAEALVVDKRTGSPALVWFAWHMKGIAAGDGSTLTVPVAGTETVAGVGSIVRWDSEEATALFDALRKDQPVPKRLLPEKGQ